MKQGVKELKNFEVESEYELKKVIKDGNREIAIMNYIIKGGKMLERDVNITLSGKGLLRFDLTNGRILENKSSMDVRGIVTDRLKEEYIKIVENVIYVENGTKIDFKNANCYLSFYHAGHMPGALMILAKVKKFRFLYTGDYTFWDITPFAGTRKFLEQMSRPIDFLLIDSTCAYEEFESISFLASWSVCQALYCCLGHLVQVEAFLLKISFILEFVTCKDSL